MLNTKMTAVREVTELFVALKAQIDEAMVTRARLETALIEGRRKARLPLGAGLDGMEKVAGMAQ
ncbi:hypothetical protein GGQ80_001449 [Sphingomonas jinjuensis]|uniref:Uncharacterized protein n=1 Tax=Sphingomonas jinjuensis TaxID=535907 RepID=A0A840FDB1_9SPHN|nr:hypothetical protein [Sphingomonas jinjuensis]MBB4153547.1 hypothetical protein [Sphingomonas jinjuensis]